MTYRDSFTPKELSRFPKDLRDTVNIALGLGWRGRIAGDGGIRMVFGSESLYVPMSNPGAGAISRIRRKIVSVPEAAERAVEAVMSGPPGTPEQVGESVVAAARFKALAEAVKPQPQPEPETPAVDEDRVLTVSPFMARGSLNSKGEGLYASKAINERVWASGKKDYICTFPECGYTSGKALSVSAHRASHRQKVDPDRTIVARTDNVEAIYTARVTRLEREIDEALQRAADAQVAPEGLAKFMAEHIVTERDRSKTPHDPLPEQEPVTPEQILSRIRDLLLPQVLSNQKNLNDQIKALMEQNRVLVEQKERATARAGRAEETLEAFASLVSEARREVRDGEGGDGVGDAP